MTSRHQRAIGLLALAACTGCGGSGPNPALTQYPGIHEQIENFYDANATEDDWVCDTPQMDTIDKSQVVSQSATQVRIAVTYYFQSNSCAGPGAHQYQGFNTRFFTFDEGSGRPLSLVAVAGPQRGASG